MPDGPKIWETVYETVYAPIKKRPLPSLSFFAVWLGAGLWLRYKWGFPEKPETAFVAAFTLAFVIPGVGLLLCLHRLLVARDPPSSLKDLGALEKIKSSFVGREDDAANLMDLILHSHQIWLNGDSGVGKSVL